MLRVALLCLLSSVAYGQAARPMPPAFNPATDAPHTVGQPGYIGSPEKAPRSPHKRVLPPTKMQGLWAGDTKAARYGGPATFEGVTIPIPWVASEAELGNAPTCAWALSELLKRDALGGLLDQLAEERRICAVAKAWDYCMRVDFYDDKARWETSENIRAKAMESFEGRCKGLAAPTFALQFGDALKEWMRPRPGGSLQ